MEGICCAAEIRSAYFIGTGNISSARITSYKSLMIGILFGAMLTYGFYELFEDQVKLFTQDATLQVCPFCYSDWKYFNNKYILNLTNQHYLQEMILDLVPLICISNMTMAAGMVRLLPVFMFQCPALLINHLFSTKALLVTDWCSGALSISYADNISFRLACNNSTRSFFCVPSTHQLARVGCCCYNWIFCIEYCIDVSADKI